ncbi:hypothetical protein JCM5350_005376 [Sporobolomyces pararoseus]
MSALRDSEWSSEWIPPKETTTKVEKGFLKNSIRGIANSLSGPFKNSTAFFYDLFLPQIDFYFVQSKFVSSISTFTVSSAFLKATFKRFTSSSSTVTPAPLSETSRFAIPTASCSSRLVPSSSIRSNLVSSTSSSTLSSSAINPTSSNSPKKRKGEPGWKTFDLQECLKRPMTWKTHLTASSALSSKPSPLARSRFNASLLSPPPLACQVSTRVVNPSLLAAARFPSASTSALPSTSVPKEQSITKKLASLPSAPSTPF